jgi:hypothetical protein
VEVFIMRVRKGTKALACLALIYCAFSFVILNTPRNAEEKVFEEKVSFGAFQRTYGGTFEIKGDTELHVSISSEIEKGSVCFSIISSTRETLYAVDGSHLNIDEYFAIPKGSWWYQIECGYKDHGKMADAENGSYSVVAVLQ